MNKSFNEKHGANFLIITATILLILLVSGVHPASAQSSIHEEDQTCVVRYPARLNSIYPFASYPKILLQAAIKVTENEFGNCRLVHVGGYSELRKVTTLTKNEGIDVAWFPASKELSEKLRHISVPIRKGMLGWRLLLTHKDKSINISQAETLVGIQGLTLGYGADWIDLPAMQKYFPKVVMSSNADNLYQMLAFKRFDIFPRAIHEASAELMFYKSEFPQLRVAPKIALYYPQADLFYVNRSNKALYNRLTKGLFILIEDGTYDRLFNRYHKRYILEANLMDRNVIKLENPNMPTDVLFDDTRLWFDPSKYD
ncbi:transporter substrate-binding domain-containing protein [Glaciecola sp. KUL10]|uniref:transporter substrate-binding domain-containing protein n=1 Tax=Glaciecola sp. (strain KUL10) TaxID=2161813 RepID=UPI000D786A25|nr:transporter substrate-binding domain-containing protein [Glaciecola sp. KUL10]GBL03197.1 ABC-type amino acid transport/signal transduction systems, periplasmic component/domain [Glaciecola sp. KUL10]